MLFKDFSKAKLHVLFKACRHTRRPRRDIDAAVRERTQHADMDGMNSEDKDVCVHTIYTYAFARTRAEGYAGFISRSSLSNYFVQEMDS